MQLFFSGNNSKLTRYELFLELCKGWEAMRLLRLAIENRRWDLAAHTIVLATAKALSNGDKPDDGKRKEKKRRPKGQPER